MGEFSGQETTSYSVPRYPFLSLTMFTKQMFSIKASKALIPKGALGEQDPSQQPYWDVAQGSDHTEPLPDWQSNFSAALHLICDIYGEVHQFFCGGKHIYFTCLRSIESTEHKVV